jgi:hypothetical protein
MVIHLFDDQKGFAVKKCRLFKDLLSLILIPVKELVWFSQANEGLDQLLENDWKILDMLSRILAVWIFFLFIIYINFFLRNPSIISKHSLLKRHLHFVLQSLLLRPFCKLSKTCRISWTLRNWIQGLSLMRGFRSWRSTRS